MFSISREESKSQGREQAHYRISGMFPVPSLGTVRTPLEVYGSPLVIDILWCLPYLRMALATDYKCFTPSFFHDGFPIRVAQLVKVTDYVNLI